MTRLKVDRGSVIATHRASQRGMRAAQRYHKFTIKTCRCQPNGTARSAQGVLLQLRGIAIAITACSKRNTASNASFLGDLAPPSTAVASHEQVFSASEQGTDRQDHGVSQGEWGRRRGEANAEARESLAFSRGRNKYSTKNAVLKTNT